jgi:hypothetical protein
MSEHTLLILLSAAFALTTVGLLIGGAVSFVRARRFLRGAAQTVGVVVANATARNSDDGVTYVPVVSFAAKNEPRSLIGKTATDPPVYTIGDRVTVCFSPENPSDAKIYSVWEIYHNALLFLFFDAAAFITAAVLYYAARH